MNTLVRRLAGAAATAVVATGLVALSGGTAFAADEQMTVSPASGSNAVSPTLTTAVACASGTSSWYALIFGGDAGHDFPADGQLMSPPSSSGFSTSSTFSVSTQFSFQDAIQDAKGASGTLLGAYTVKLICQDDFSNALTTFAAPVNFSSATAYTAPAATVATTTSLAASPSGSAQQGTPVTLTATVTPASGPAATGTVEFFDGATSIGTAPVSGGTGSRAFSSLGVGSHSFTATFTGSGFGSSTSAPVSYTVTQAPAQSTTTTLTVSPAGSSTVGEDVTMTADVAPASAVGNVEFYDGAVKIDTKPLASGQATTTKKLYGAGVHTLTAKFVPADPAAFTGSQDSKDQNVTGPTSSLVAYENVTVTLAETGALTISVADDSVVLPNFTLDAAADKLSTEGDMNDVTVTDTRLYEQGWTVSGQVSDFANGDGSRTISGNGLGWTPRVVSKPADSPVITAGTAVSPFQDGSGLKGSRTLANAPADNGRGTTVLNATLLLKAPTTTVPDTYTALLTLTAV